MTKEEFVSNSLYSALQKMKEVSNILICLPSLKEKADNLYNEIQQKYEK